MTIENAEGEQETIDSTPEHPFYVEGLGWVNASALRPGMVVWLSDGSKVIIEDVWFEYLEDAVAVFNFKVEDFHTYFVGYSGVLVHNSECGNIAPAKPEKVVNALDDYETARWNVDGNNIAFDKSGMKHALERHHPDYWDGSVKSSQTFFSDSLSITDIQDIAGQVINQNRDTIIANGTTGMYQIEGVVDGIKYVLGFNNGRIGQLYPTS